MMDRNVLLKAKIPCDETGIQIRKSICDICTPISHCGLDVYVKDNTILKVEGASDFPSAGKLCTKGLANRFYIYREDRIKTPLLRIGERGQNKFVEITWKEAYERIATGLNGIKSKAGADAVAWFVGYEKWCRSWVQRLAYSYGSRNYGTESSTCHMATVLAGVATLGAGVTRWDVEHANVFLGWGSNPYMNMHFLANSLENLKRRGGKIIIIDPKKTVSVEKLADLHLQIRPGTDGALALGLANYIIEKHLYCEKYVDAYVHGFQAFAEMVRKYTLEVTSDITGVPREQIIQMAEMYTTAQKAAAYISPASVTHHVNGFNSIRSIYCLQAITGNIDVEGGNVPASPGYCLMETGFETMETRFSMEKMPEKGQKRIGEDKFPIWSLISPQMQATELANQIMTETPYPVRALVNFGMNHRMFPQPTQMLQAFQKLDFVVSVDLFLTDACKYSDIVLPACSSLERSELKGWPGGYLTYTQPVIEPLYQSKADTEIVCDLARVLDVDDDLLKAGYEETIKYMISNLSVTVDELKASQVPVKVKETKPYIPGTMLKNGFPTKTGKIELFSELISEISQTEEDMNPLPDYEREYAENLKSEYPLHLITGASLANNVNSRLHHVKELRILRDEPLCELHPDTAKKENIKEGDLICISTVAGSVCLKAHFCYGNRRDDIYVYHGYEEADVNELIPWNYRDRYSGFPGYGNIPCKIKKVVEE